MLINDREIKNIHVSKVIDIARVAITNNFYDLDGRPSSYPPSSHRHNNATTSSDGFMSKEDFNKLNNTAFWKTVMLRDRNLDTYVNATTTNDTFTLVAGKDIVFFVDKIAKRLTIAVDYTKEESNGGTATSPKDGKDGKPGISWRPSINNGILSFTGDNALSTTPPPSTNIKGLNGNNGKDGTTYKPVIQNNSLSFVIATNNDTSSLPSGFNTKGEKGEKGNDGKTWKPSISDDGTVSFSESNRNDTSLPKSVNVRGKCIHGYDGKDASNNASWDTLYGIPMGRDGQSLVFRDGKISSDDIVFMGAFPNLDEEEEYLEKFNKSEHYIRHIQLFKEGRNYDKKIITPIKDEDIMINFPYPSTINKPLFLIDEINYDKARYDFVFDGSNNFLSGFKNFNHRPYFYRQTNSHDNFNIGLLLGYTRNKRHNLNGYDTLSLHFYDNENLVYRKHSIFNNSQLSNNSYVAILWFNYGQDTETILAYKCYNKNDYKTSYDSATTLGYTCFQIQKQEIISEIENKEAINDISGKRNIRKDGIKLSFGIKSMTEGKFYFINENNPDNPTFGNIFGFMNLTYRFDSGNISIDFENLSYKRNDLLNYIKPFFPNSIYFGIVLHEEGFTLNNLLVTHDIDFYRKSFIYDENLIKKLSLTTYPNKHNRIINVETNKSRVICNNNFYTINEDITNLVSGKMLIDDITNKLYHYNENQFINLNYSGSGNGSGNNEGNIGDDTITEVILLNNFKPGPNITSEYILL